MNSANAGSRRQLISPAASLTLLQEGRGSLAFPIYPQIEKVCLQNLLPRTPRVLPKPVALAWRQRPSCGTRATATLPYRAFAN